MNVGQVLFCRTSFGAKEPQLHHHSGSFKVMKVAQVLHFSTSALKNHDLYDHIITSRDCQLELVHFTLSLVMGWINKLMDDLQLDRPRLQPPPLNVPHSNPWSSSRPIYIRWEGVTCSASEHPTYRINGLPFIVHAVDRWTTEVELHECEWL